MRDIVADDGKIVGQIRRKATVGIADLIITKDF